LGLADSPTRAVDSGRRVSEEAGIDQTTLTRRPRTASGLSLVRERRESRASASIAEFLKRLEQKLEAAIT